MSEVDEDERLARELQEQFNQEIEQNKTTNADPAANEQYMADLAFAQKLAKEFEDAAKKPSTTTSNNSSEEKVVPGVEDTVRKQQEEIDLMMAMKLQEGEYQFDDKPHHYTPPVHQPPVYQPPAPYHYKKPKLHQPEAPPSAEAVKRITSDLKEVIFGKNPTIFVSPDEDDITHIQALIIGPEDTPYAQGLFHFDMSFPHDYPWRPPKVEIQTTDNGTCRFNPNLYSNGKVCLSILGTWQGPGWTQIQTILSTLLSIQSLMNSKPYHNEPGYEQERTPGDVEKYNQCILHETIRVAVVGMMENPTCGDLFRDTMEDAFLKNYSYYESTCTNLAPVFDGKQMEDPMGEQRGSFKYGQLLKKLKEIKEKVEKRREEEANQMQIEEERAKAEEEEKAKQSTVENQAPVSSDPAQKVDSMDTSDSAQPSDSQVAPQDNVPTQEHPSSAMVVEDPNKINPPANPTPAAAPKIFTLDDLKTLGSAFPPAQTTEEQGQVDMASQLTEQLIAAAKKQFELDEELARKIQESMYEEAPKYKQPKPYSGSYSGITAPTSNFATVKAPKMSDLLAEAKVTNEEEESVSCLVCHQSLKEYVILPNCQQPHIYCIPCAGKMVKSGGNQMRGGYHHRSYNQNKRTKDAQTIQCVLCSAVSTLDPVGGLKSLRRKRRKVEEKSDKCPEHREEFYMYCMDDHELICLVCASEKHSRHNIEALDVAMMKVQGEVQTQLSQMEKKRENLETFVKQITEQQTALSKSAEEMAVDAKKKIQALREILDAKDKEIEETIKRTENSKNSTIQNELNKAKSRMDVIDTTISKTHEAVTTSSPLGFLQKIEDIEEDLRHSTMTADPKSDQKWFSVAPLFVQPVEQILRNIKYSDKMRNGNYNMFGGDEYDEEYEEYSGDE